MGDAEQERAELGARLRELRHRAELTGRELARAAGWDPSRVSRYETGRQTPSEGDIRIWCTLTDATDQIPDLIASLHHIGLSQLEWRRLSSRRLQHRTAHIESRSRLIRGFDCFRVPGLLQTLDYATGILRMAIEFVGSTESVDDAVQQRMDRQHAVVRRKKHHLHFIIAEQAMYTTIEDDATMVGQLEHLLDCTRMPNTTLGVIPRMATLSVPATSFLMYGNTEVVIETMSSSLSITQPGEIALYDKGFQRLYGQSLIGERARELIHRALTARTGSD
ncbi:helix-turn-helix domain-containing protein [Nocardia sp. CA-128927]|uniref:helix-turn-helix domain-containing protein n=1 Tax=Nocardia sp. CA-128927 TaxID=3239975 RepID=UPI003D985D6F